MTSAFSCFMSAQLALVLCWGLSSTALAQTPTSGEAPSQLPAATDASPPTGKPTEAQQPEAQQPEAQQPAAKPTEAQQPEAQQPAAKPTETQQPEPQQAPAKPTEPQQPGAQQPAAKPTEAQQPAAPVSQTSDAALSAPTQPKPLANPTAEPPAKKKLVKLSDLKKSAKKLAPPKIPATEGCPDTNLLAGLNPVLPTSSVTRSLKLTDGNTVKEGTSWNVTEATIIKVRGRVTYDLGRSVALSAFLVQGDNNDSYEVYGSQDGKKFSQLWTAGPVKGAGLRRRAERLQSPTEAVRYLQLRASGGDKSYSASELQAFCATPKSWPPETAVVTARTEKSSKDTRKHFIGFAKIGVGLLGLLIFFIPRLMRRAPREGEEDPDEPIEGRHLSRWITLLGLPVTIYMIVLGGLQISSAYQDWRDNGLINQINGYFPIVFDGLDKQEIAFLNGSVLALVGLLSLVYVISLISKTKVFTERSMASLETLGLVGLVWVVMTQADELLGKTSAWWPKGWEGIVVAAVMSLILIALHLFKFTRTRRNLGWMTTLLLGLMTWVSLGSFHGNRITHFWDSYHYYVGSKYFAENRYHLIYHCTILAERDDGRESKIKGRALRNLVDNEMTKADEVLDEQNELVKECRAHFSPERWEAFKQDTRLFRSYMGESWWAKMFKDHGYNATPVWTLVGSLISQRDWAAKVPPPELVYTPQKRNGRSSKQLQAARKRFYDEDRPRFEKEIIALNFIDLSLYSIFFLMFLWAFGLETTAFVALVFAIGYPWSYDWTGGSFGRIPWLFTAVAGLCFLKRGLPFLGGFALGWSLLLRVFPGAVLGGAGLQILLMILKRDPWTQTYKRFMYGGLTSLALLIPLSLVTGQGVGEEYRGVSVYAEFFSNSLKHKDTPLTNNMGYPTILAFHTSYTVGRSNVLQRRMEAKTKEKKPNFWLWKTKHREYKKRRQPIQILTVIGMFAFLYVMRKRWKIWEMTAASSVFIFLIFELTCYYYSFLVLLAPLAFQRSRDIFGLLTIGVASQVIQIVLGPTDLEYFWESIFVLAPMLLFVLGWTSEQLLTREGTRTGEPAFKQSDAPIDDLKPQGEEA